MLRSTYAYSPPDRPFSPRDKPEVIVPAQRSSNSAAHWSSWSANVPRTQIVSDQRIWTCPSQEFMWQPHGTIDVPRAHHAPTHLRNKLCSSASDGVFIVAGLSARPHNDREPVAHRIPPEVLLIIVENAAAHLVHRASSAIDKPGQGGLQWMTYRRRKRAPLGNIALVCRSWFVRCAPILYQDILVNTSEKAAFRASLRSPHSHLAPHVRELGVRGPNAWAVCAELCRSLPLVQAVWCSPTDDDTDVSLHHTHFLMGRISAGYFCRAVNVRQLALGGLTFQSSRDLLQVVAAFPALVSLSLNQVYTSQAHSAVTIAFAGFSRMNVINMYDCPNAEFSVVRLLTWPHSKDDLHTHDFPGLTGSESHTIARILALRNSSSAYDCYIDRLATGWIVTTYTYRSHLEFYMRQLSQHAPRNGRRRPHFATIRGVAYRGVRMPDIDTMRTLALELSRLPHLRRVVFEVAVTPQSNALHPAAIALSILRSRVTVLVIVPKASICLKLQGRSPSPPPIWVNAHYIRLTSQLWGVERHICRLSEWGEKPCSYSLLPRTFRRGTSLGSESHEPEEYGPWYSRDDSEPFT